MPRTAERERHSLGTAGELTREPLRSRVVSRAAELLELALESLPLS